MGSLVTSTPAKIMAVSEIPGSLVASCCGGRWWSCRYTWSFSGPTPLNEQRQEGVKTNSCALTFLDQTVVHNNMSQTCLNMRSIPALSDLYSHGAGHHISGGQVLGIGCIALHEALSLTVDQDASLTTATLCDQATSSIDPYKDWEMGST